MWSNWSAQNYTYLNCTILLGLTYIPHKTITSQTFPSFSKVSLCPFSSILFSSSLPRQLLIYVLSVYRLACIFLSFLWVESYNLFSFLAWLLALSVMILRLIHIVVYVNSYVSLLLSSIPLHGYTTACLFICVLMDLDSFWVRGYYKWSSNEHSRTNLWVLWLQFSSANTSRYHLTSASNMWEFQMLHGFTNVWYGQSFSHLIVLFFFFFAQQFSYLLASFLQKGSICLVYREQCQMIPVFQWSD